MTEPLTWLRFLEVTNLQTLRLTLRTVGLFPSLSFRISLWSSLCLASTSRVLSQLKIGFVSTLFQQPPGNTYHGSFLYTYFFLLHAACVRKGWPIVSLDFSADGYDAINPTGSRHNCDNARSNGAKKMYPLGSRSETLLLDWFLQCVERLISPFFTYLRI